MHLQRVDYWRSLVEQQFHRIKRDHPERFERRINFSWSNWAFGLESLQVSARRLTDAGVRYIELHGNHHGPDLGYRPRETVRILEDHDLLVSGICGIFSSENDFASTSALSRQRAIDYTRREIEFCAAVGGSYVLVVPGAVGRPQAYDDYEWDRSAQALRIVGDSFMDAGVKGAVEPIRSSEVSLVHSVADAIRFIEQVDHPGIQHINGDTYHMQAEERNVPLAVIEAGDRLVNLHIADTNRRGVGQGSLDVDTVIRALYVLGFNSEGHFVTAEPLGPGAAPYSAMHSLQDPVLLDRLVADSVAYWREREKAVVDG